MSAVGTAHAVCIIVGRTCKLWKGRANENTNKLEPIILSLHYKMYNVITE